MEKEGVVNVAHARPVLWWQQMLSITRQRARVIRRMVSLAPALTSAEVTRVSLSVFEWRTKEGHELKPTTLANLISALSMGVRTLTGVTPDLAVARRRIAHRMRTHVRTQAVPATATQIKLAIASTTSTELRCRLALSWVLGLRAGDSIHIRASDILSITERGALLRMRGVKGQKPGAEGYYRALPLCGMTSRLRPFLEAARIQGGSLFPSTTTRSVVRALKSVHPHLSGHSIRRGAATALRNSGASMETLRRFLGHQSVESTRLYVEPSLTQACFRKRLELQSRLV